MRENQSNRRPFDRRPQDEHRSERPIPTEAKSERQGKDRRVVYGLRPVMEAVKGGQDIEKLLVQKGLKGELAQELLNAAREAACPIQYLPPEALQRLFPNVNHQGVAAYISPVPFWSIEDVLPRVFEAGRVPLVLIFDRITDVRNFGAMVRTAEGAGVDAVVIPAHHAAAMNEDAVKASAGALLTVPICREANLKSAIHFLKASGLKLVAVTEKGSVNYTEISYKEPTAFVLGSEEDGVSPEYLKLCDARARIPMLGRIESLNVSVANGILLYEALRQRG